MSPGVHVNSARGRGTGVRETGSKEAKGLLVKEKDELVLKVDVETNTRNCKGGERCREMKEALGGKQRTKENIENR